MAKYTAKYMALVPTQERIVVFADDPETALSLIRQEIGQQRVQDLKQLGNSYQPEDFIRES